MLKVCFIGIGSIGKRHLTNLIQICKEKNIDLEIDALSSHPNKEYDNVSNVYYSFETLPNHYDIIFICNLTSLHYETLEKTKNKAKMFFVEKPVFSSAINSLSSFYYENKEKYYVACPLRYTNVIEYVQHHIPKDSILSIRSICSSYLPEWRPHVDYRKIYSARKELGGGVIIDLIHELDYITYLLGIPKEINGYYNQISALEINSEDIATYIAKYDHSIVEIHLDYFGRIPRREIEILTDNNVIIGDLNKNIIKFLCEDKEINFDEKINDRYIKELTYFLEIYFKNIENKNDLIHANQILGLAESIERKGE